MMKFLLMSAGWIYYFIYGSTTPIAAGRTSISIADMSCSSSIWLSFRSNISHDQVFATKQNRSFAMKQKPHVAPDNLAYITEPNRAKRKRLTVGILTWPQVVSYDPSRNKYTGFPLELLEDISEQLNFTYSLVEPADGQWGAYNNGSWNGLVGNLVTKEFDLVAAPLTRLSEREAVIDMVCPISMIEFKIWILNPEMRTDKSLFIFDLMDPLVCVLYIAVYLGVVVAYTLADTTPLGTYSESYCSQLLLRLSKSGMLLLRSLLQQGFLIQVELQVHKLYAKELRRKDITAVDMETFNILYLIFTVILISLKDRGNGSTDLPQRNARRTILAFWWWFSVLSYVVYSGTVIATQADSRPVYPFTTVEGMLKQNIYKYGIVGNSVVETFLQESKIAQLRNLLESVRRFAKEDPTVMSKDLSEHFRKMNTEKYAFIGANRNASGKYVSLNDELGVGWSCMGLPKNSSLTEPVKTIVDTFMAHGIMQALWRKYGLVQSKSALFEDDNENNSSVNLDLYPLKSAFIFLIIGILLSGLILMFEIVVYSFKNHPISSRPMHY